MASSRRRATSSRSSRRTTAKVEAVNPCLREFWAERDLPSGERGPVDWAALARLAARCLSEVRLVIGSFRFEGYHGEGVEPERGMGQVVGGEGVKFLELEALARKNGIQRRDAEIAEISAEKQEWGRVLERRAQRGDVRAALGCTRRS